VKKVNALIFIAIKKILENQPKGKWVEELPRAVWSHNTSVYRMKKFTPFKLLYGEEPVTLEEIKLCIARTKMEATYSPSEAEAKDLLEPKCMKAVENLQSYQNETRAWRDKKVKLRNIEAEGSGIAVKPTHRSFRETGTQVDRTIQDQDLSV
jgi:hypothetical protein